MERKELEQHVFANTLLFADKMQILGDTFIKPVTFKQWFLLLLISNIQKEMPSITDIAEFSGSTRQNISKMIGILEEKGFVLTEQNAVDKRNLMVALTPASIQLFEDVREMGDKVLGKLFAQTTDENLLVTLQTLKQVTEVSVTMEEEYE